MGINPFTSLWEFCLFSLYLLWGSLACISRCKAFLQEETSGSWFPGHPWGFLSSTSSLDYHLLSSFFLLLRQRPYSFTPRQRSAWSHHWAWCGWEEADSLISLLTSKTRYFLLFELQRKCYAQSENQWELLSPLENIPLLHRIWCFSSLHPETEMNVFGLWFHSGKNELPNEVWWFPLILSLICFSQPFLSLDFST